MDNKNNVPVVPAASNTESVLMAAAEVLSEKDRIIAERDRTITECDETIAEQQRLLDDLRHTIANTQRAPIKQSYRLKDPAQLAAAMAAQGEDAPPGNAALGDNKKSILL
ncbi:hypothetical protein GGI17_006299 [Coemansia sp. S146]|nr:hypothetical protein GGI17_006299 [Coemansia sp. S146]